MADENPDNYEETAPLSSKKLKKAFNGLGILITCVCTFNIVMTIALLISIFCLPHQISPHDGISTDNVECTSIGSDILQQSSSSSADASIAATFCLTLVEPQLTGIAGDGFVIIKEIISNNSVAINFRGVSPSDLNLADYSNSPTELGLKVAIPGFLKGLWALHKRFGKSSWSSLIQPTINLATNGFRVSRSLANALAVDVPADAQGSGFFGKYFYPNGNPLKEGTRVKFPEYANTLRTIQRLGASAFYNGELGNDFINTVGELGTTFKKSDLQGYEAFLEKVVRMYLRGNGSFESGITVLGAAPPASSVTSMMIVNIMNGFKNQNMSSIPLIYHRFIEASKLSFAARTSLGDPRFATNRSIDRVLEMIDPALGYDWARRIPDNQVIGGNPEAYGAASYLNPATNGGSHVSVVDSGDQFVSITTSIGSRFGLKRWSKKGYLLNDIMMDFSFGIPAAAPLGTSLPPSESNMVSQGKRPLSAMSPLILLNSDHRCQNRWAIGAVNSTKGISGAAQYSIFGLLSGDLLETMQASRVHNSLFPNVVSWDNTDLLKLTNSVRQQLNSFGHKLNDSPDLPGVSVVNIAFKFNMTADALSDIRSSGAAYHR